MCLHPSLDPVPWPETAPSTHPEPLFSTQHSPARHRKRPETSTRNSHWGTTPHPTAPAGREAPPPGKDRRARTHRRSSFQAQRFGLALSRPTPAATAIPIGALQGLFADVRGLWRSSAFRLQCQQLDSIPGTDPLPISPSNELGESFRLRLLPYFSGIHAAASFLSRTQSSKVPHPTPFKTFRLVLPYQQMKDTVSEWPIAFNSGIMLPAGKADLRELSKAGGGRSLQLIEH